jgi:hypothetical protein
MWLIHFMVASPNARREENKINGQWGLLSQPNSTST